MDDFGKAPKKKYADSGQRPQGGAKSRSKSAAKARKYGIKYATQEQMDKDFDLSDGEKAWGRPGRGKMKTQGMNRSKRSGFSGRGSGAAQIGF